MNEQTVTAIGAFLASIVGLAALAVILGKSSQTATVLQGFGGAISSIIGAAVAPASGSSASNSPLSGLSGILGGGSGGMDPLGGQLSGILGGGSNSIF